MGFVNASLLFGGLLAGLPVVLHLILRQQPKRIVFPALQFLKQRHESNRRELQLRHWLLLALRCGIILLGAAALARPSVASAAMGNWFLVGLLFVLAAGTALVAVVAAVRRRGRLLVGSFLAVAALLLLGSSALAVGTLVGGKGMVAGDRQTPVAAAFVIDTSPRMGYRFQNQTRLEAARETARWLLRQFPPESQVAVLESRPGPAFFAVDFAATASMIDRLRVTGTPDQLPAVIRRAIDLVAPLKDRRQEVYVFTDLTRQSWPDEEVRQLKSRLDEFSNVLFYIIDVGADRPRNVALGDLVLSAETLVQSSELVLRTDVRSQGGDGEFVVELSVEQPDLTRPILVDGKPQLPIAQVRDRRSVTLSADLAQRVEFRIRGWEPGTHQGTLRIRGEDGLAVDNERFFAVEVRDAWPALLVAPSETNTTLLLETLSPFEQRETNAARFACEMIAQGDLANHTLSSHAFVCLLDPKPLPPAQWEQLGHYVEQGGGLLVMLGANADPTGPFNEPAAQRILGGKLVRQWRSAGRELFLSPQRLDHPALTIFRQQSSGVPWQELPVFRHWVLQELAADIEVVAAYSNGKPAIIERPLGKGRIVIATTPLTEEARPPGRPPWNELITGDNAWPSFVLINELARYLVSGGENRLNYRTGETAALVNDTTRDPDRYQLFPPSEDPQEVVPRDGQLQVAFTEQPGAYRLKGQRGGPVVRGFAVNLPGDASDLTRVSREDLDSLLGKGRFRFARNRDEIVLEVGEARAGREFFPYLLVIVALVLGMEQALANRFYRKSDE